MLHIQMTRDGQMTEQQQKNDSINSGHVFRPSGPHQRSDKLNTEQTVVKFKQKLSKYWSNQSNKQITSHVLWIKCQQYVWQAIRLYVVTVTAQ